MNEHNLIIELRNNDEKAFATLFHHYYRDMVLFAGGFIKEIDVCEDIVQSTFINLWTKRDGLSEIDSIRLYLLKCVQNSCFNHIRHIKVRNIYSELKSLESIDGNYYTDDYILYSELNNRLEDALQMLSPMQKTCFVKGKLQGIKYSEISSELNISIRTVELKVSEALKVIRQYLKEYNFLFTLLISL